MSKKCLLWKRAVLPVLFILLLSVVGMTNAMSQTPYRQYANDGILLNFHEIDDVDFRVFLLYNLSQDDQFILIEDDAPGLFSISSNNEEGYTDFYDAFESFYQNTYADFNLLSKTDIFDLFPNWKSSIPPTYLVSIMMDVSLQNTRNDNYLCANSLPFYTTDVVQYEAAITSQTAIELEGTYFDVGCIGSPYNPSWFHLQISNPGQFVIHLEGRDPNTGVNRDIDFCVWGPFTDPITPCVAQLTTDKIMDCSYSASYSEDMFLGFPEGEHVHSTSHGTVNYHMPESGEYYILMITNFSRQPCVISFSQVGGNGTSGCYGQKNITTNVNSVECGLVAGAGEYECGSLCTLTATANEGYVFMDWTDENGVVVSTEAEYTFTVYNNKNFTANFIEESNICYLTFSLNDSNGNGWSDNYLVLNFEDGSSQKLTLSSGSSATYSLPFVNGSHISLGWISGLYTDQCSYLVSYSNGNVIYYSSNPNNGINYEFDVDCVGMPGNTMSFDVMAEANPLEGGTVTGAGQYDFNETCTLTAIANGGFGFVNWTEEGVVVSTTPTYSFNVGHNRNLVANFNQYMKYWTAESYQNDMFMIGVVQIDGMEQESPSLELGAFCDGECRGSEFPIYDEGRWLYFMAIGGNNGDDITFRLYDHALQQELNLYCFNVLLFEKDGFIGMDEPYEVLFVRQFTVSVIVNPEDAGTVTGSGTYINGTEVNLTASANENSTFIGWTIGDEQVSTNTTYSFIVTEDVTLVANFLPRYEVTAWVDPEEGGSVSGAGIYDNGTNCTLVATANPGYVFSSWSIDGELVSTEPSYTFTVTAPVNLTANFSVLWPVSAVVSPENAGTISGEGEYVLGTEVTLVATANEGFAFNNWTLDGEIVSTEPFYTFMVTGTMNFTANFDVLYSVSAIVSPENAGTVSGLGEYVLGAEVTLTAAANEGYAFNSWIMDGEIVSTEFSYTFTVTGSVSLTANFDVVQSQQFAIGWNWFSAYVDITLDELKAALVEVLPGTSITIMSQINGSTTYNGNMWRGGLNTLDMAQMYMIETNSDCEMTLTGIAVNPAEHPITIRNGFNWISFPFNQSMTLSNAFSGFAVNGDMVVSQFGSAAYYNGFWRGNFNSLEPGKGYLYKSNVQGDRIFSFPINK